MNLKQIKSKKYVIAGALVLAILVLAVIYFSGAKTYATEEYWCVNIGEDTVAVLNDESSAKQVIRDVKNYYVEEGAVVKAISCTPEMTVVQKICEPSERPEISGVEEAVEFILSGTKERIIYEVKTGDNLWSIAEEHNLSLDEITEMNKESNLDMIFPGDELKLYQAKPLVNVTVTQEITAEKKMKYKTVKKSSASVLKNTVVVEKEGAFGKKKVTEIVTTKNGVVTDSEVIHSEVVKKPEKRVIVKGTGILPAPTDGGTYRGSGQAVANYAMKYVGNPYVYGGSSLTKGADCSGFVLAVYHHFGITMAHDAGAMRNYGRGVSMAEAQPGDLICYYGHVGIYVGGGMVVHAVNEGMGIAVTGVGYTGPVIAVRRIVE